MIWYYINGIVSNSITVLERLSRPWAGVISGGLRRRTGRIDMAPERYCLRMNIIDGSM